MPNISTEYTQTLIAGLKRVQPATSFLRDRYFSEINEFNTEKVLMDYKDGNRKVAPFILSGGKSVTTDDFTTVEYEPPRIAPKTTLTIDRLKKRGFGEALESELSPAERELAMNLEDLQDLDKRITRREELLCASALLDNKLEMIHQNSETDTSTTTKTIKFYTGDTNPQTYTPATCWDATGVDIIDDLAAAACILKDHGMPAIDVIMGDKALSVFLRNDKVQKILDNRRFNIGTVDPMVLTGGAYRAAVVNADGIDLNIIGYRETYTDDSGITQKYIPSGSVIVTAPGCGRRLYGCVTQLEPTADGSSEYFSYTGNRVPKYLADYIADKRELILTSKPVVVPNATYGWVSINNVLTEAESSSSSASASSSSSASAG